MSHEVPFIPHSLSYTKYKASVHYTTAELYIRLAVSVRGTSLWSTYLNLSHPSVFLRLTVLLSRPREAVCTHACFEGAEAGIKQFLLRSQETAPLAVLSQGSR